MQLNLPQNVIFRGQRIAGIVDDPSKLDPTYLPYQKIEEGGNVTYSEQSLEFYSSCYGVVHLERGRISVKIPIIYDKNKIKGVLFIFADPNGKIPTIEDLRSVAIKLDIKHTRTDEELMGELAKIDANRLKEQQVGAPLLFAQGFQPQDGWNRYYILQVDTKVKSGKLREDGSIDYKERDFIHQINKGEPIAKEVPAKEVKHGMDIFGKEIKGRKIPHPEYRLGDNIAQNPQDPLLHVAAINGRVVVNPPNVYVHDQVYIAGDVDYSTGNIDFSGNIEIQGSVMGGFHVKAGGNIFIHENIEGGSVDSRGNLTVKGGIKGGEETQVYVKGQIQAHHLQNCFIRAEGNVTIEESIVNCDIMTRGAVQLQNDKQGKILGGSVIGKHGIKAAIVGSSAGTDTFLGARMDPDVYQKLSYYTQQSKDLEEDKKELNNVLLKNYGQEFFKNPKEFIAHLPTMRRKQVVEQLKELQEISQKLKEHQEKQEMYSDLLKTPDDTKIVITNEVYPPTKVQLKGIIKNFEKKAHHLSVSLPPQQGELKITYF